MSEKKYWSKKIETISSKELKIMQLKRLKYIIKYVYNRNRFYHDRLKKADIIPSSITRLKDIEKIPFLTKNELREYYPFGLVCVEMDNIVEIHASSGTTGKPVVGCYTKNDISLWTDVMARCLYANGLRKNDIMQNAYGYGLFTGAHGFEKGAQRIGALVVPTSSGNTKRQITIMRDFGVTAIACTPSYSLYIAEVAEKEGLNPQTDFKLRLGLFGAESWSDEMKKKIEETWNIKAMEHYGLTEIIGPGVSLDCGNGMGLHVNADNFYMEVIDPETGEHVNEDEKGELVFTTLTKEALPIIRFRTRDLASFTEKKCNCGRTLPRHSRILGRSDDMMKVKGVIVFPSQIEEVLMRIPSASENYQIVKHKKGMFTELLLRIEPEKKLLQREKNKLKKEIEDEIYAILNIKIGVEIVPKNSLPRSEGKAKRIIEC